MNDLISRKAAIDAILTELTKQERKNLLLTWTTVEVKYFVADMLEKMPSAQPVARDINVPTNNCINRQEAIDQLHQSYNLFDAERRLEDMPSAQPEPCEDVVSKEAVSSWLKQYGQDVLHGKYKFSLMYIWKNLMDLPSVTPKQRWIPYGKRKPDKPTISGLYIVSGIWKSGSAFVCPCAYNGELGRFETPYNSYIVAWMSLPEPYKAESEEV